VDSTPLLDEPAGPSRKAAAECLTTIDPDQRLVLRIDGMEMRGCVVEVVHLDGDPVEAGE
jgi:hypothetical protein